MSKPRLRTGRLVLAMSFVSALIVAANSIMKDLFPPNTKIIIDGNFKSSSSAAPIPGSDSTILGNPTEPSGQNETGISYIGYSEINIAAEQLSSGLLTVINSEHPYTASDTSSMVRLKDFKNEFYSIRSEDIMLDSSAADALNLMMADYNAATQLSDIIIYTTTQQYTGSDSACPTVFAESASGLTIDLAVQGSDGSVLVYDGADVEGWILENCTRYGFIVRYPDGKDAVTGQPGNTWHLRYVGNVHAAVMAQNNQCLEEYVEWIKGYSIDTQTYTCNLDGMEYEIYYTPYMGDTTSIRVPVSGSYTISGNNIDGIIISALK